MGNKELVSSEYEFLPEEVPRSVENMVKCHFSFMPSFCRFCLASGFQHERTGETEVFGLFVDLHSMDFRFVITYMRMTYISFKLIICLFWILHR